MITVCEPNFIQRHNGKRVTKFILATSWNRNDGLSLASLIISGRKGRFINSWWSSGVLRNQTSCEYFGLGH